MRRPRVYRNQVRTRHSCATREVASAYGDTVGVPAVFERGCFAYSGHDEASYKIYQTDC